MTANKTELTRINNNWIYGGLAMSEPYRPGAAFVCFLIASLPATANAALLGRLPATPGGTDYQAYYDDQLNISWAASANIGAPDDWFNVTAAASAYTVGGVSGWRLPDVDVNGDGNIVSCNGVITECQDNELSYMVWVNGYYPMNPGPFANLDQSGIYASGTEYVPDSNQVWEISLSVNRTPGSISTSLKSYASFQAWFVHDGDVGAVPIPAAAWLFCSGLLGLIGVSRRKVAT